jgi:hypothetical protein
MEKKVINQEVSNATTTAAFAMAMKLLNKIKETDDTNTQEREKLFEELQKYEDIISRIVKLESEDEDEATIHLYLSRMERFKSMIMMNAPTVIIMAEHKLCIQTLYPEVAGFDMDAAASTVLAYGIRNNDSVIVDAFLNNYMEFINLDEFKKEAEDYLYYCYNHEVSNVLVKRGIISEKMRANLAAMSVLNSNRINPENEVRENYYYHKAIKMAMSGEYETAAKCCSRYNYYNGGTLEEDYDKIDYADLACLVIIHHIKRNDYKGLYKFLENIENEDRFDKDDIHNNLHDMFEDFFDEDNNDPTVIKAIIKEWDESHGYTYEEA